VSAAPRDAATVILLRPAAGGDGFEVFLLRRRKGASFMSGAFVFPGGAAEPGEDLRAAAARELFEEAGVLLADDAPGADELAAWRREVLAGGSLESRLAAAGRALALDALHPYAHWVTPSVEPRRFSARFFVARLPLGQVPSFDAQETVDEAWVTPADALARRVELALPPPQLRTFFELAQHGSVDEVLAACAVRARTPHPILPRLAPGAGGLTLLLPWDPDYETAGTGDAAPMPAAHPLGGGPSRLVLEGRGWNLLHAPTA
jgi:8-oxo-dGTP pyrophosphatase MutT (NUDIX family)